MFSWWIDAPASARRALLAASIGWMLDAFDTMLYALLIPAITRDLALSSNTAGLVQSATLVASAAGGIGFGVLADRWGRTRALMLSVLIYSIFTAACGFATTAIVLAVLRVCLGIGMGGEWASGAALVSETWSDRDRGKALGFMQSAWAIGYALAAVVNWLVQDVAGYGWRAVFFVGVLPALYALWVRAKVEEPAAWQAARGTRTSLVDAVGGTRLKITIILTLMNACTMFAWWGLQTWVPSFLRSAAGLSNAAMNGFVVAMQVGMWFGYVSFGYVSDAVGRRRAYVSYLLIAAVAVLMYSFSRTPWVLFALGPDRRVFRHRLFQRIRRSDGRGLSNARARHSAGPHLQHRPHRKRRRALARRHARANARLRRRAFDHLRRARRGGGILDFYSRNQGRPPPLTRHAAQLRRGRLCEQIYLVIFVTEPIR